jgi:hypothetical protein
VYSRILRKRWLLDVKTRKLDALPGDTGDGMFFQVISFFNYRVFMEANQTKQMKLRDHRSFNNHHWTGRATFSPLSC